MSKWRQVVAKSETKVELPTCRATVDGDKVRFMLGNGAKFEFEPDFWFLLGGFLHGLEQWASDAGALPKGATKAERANAIGVKLESCLPRMAWFKDRVGGRVAAPSAEQVQAAAKDLLAQQFAGKSDKEMLALIKAMTAKAA